MHVCVRVSVSACVHSYMYVIVRKCRHVLCVQAWIRLTKYLCVLVGMRACASFCMNAWVCMRARVCVYPKSEKNHEERTGVRHAGVCCSSLLLPGGGSRHGFRPTAHVRRLLAVPASTCGRSQHWTRNFLIFLPHCATANAYLQIIPCSFAVLRYFFRVFLSTCVTDPHACNIGYLLS